MKHVNTTRLKGFKVVAGTRAAQGAVMVLRPGQATSDEPENEHPRAEQWLYVARGSGVATVGRSRVQLREGSLLVVEKAERHQIRNTGRGELLTINVYVPPAYTKGGEVKPSVKR